MTDKEIINPDGSRNWQANILLDNIKQLEAENARLKEDYEALISNMDFEVQKKEVLEAENARLKRENEIITGMHNSASNRFDKIYQVLQKIKEITEDINSDIKILYNRKLHNSLRKILDLINENEVTNEMD